MQVMEKYKYHYYSRYSIGYTDDTGKWIEVDTASNEKDAGEKTDKLNKPIDSDRILA